jgi:hypothetical protein
LKQPAFVTQYIHLIAVVLWFVHDCLFEKVFGSGKNNLDSKSNKETMKQK